MNHKYIGCRYTNLELKNQRFYKKINRPRRVGEIYIKIISVFIKLLSSNILQSVDRCLNFKLWRPFLSNTSPNSTKTLLFFYYVIHHIVFLNQKRTVETAYLGWMNPTVELSTRKGTNLDLSSGCRKQTSTKKHVK